MKLTIFGKTDGVGSHLISLALEAGHEVTVLALDSRHLKHDFLNVVIGELDDAAAVEDAIKGSDAVLSTLGAQSHSLEHLEAFTRAIRIIAKAMNEEGVARFVSISSSRVITRNHKSVRSGATTLSRLLLKLIGRYTSDTKQREYEIIEATKLSWILVSPYTLSPGPTTGTYRVYESMLDISRVWRAAGLNVAQKNASVNISEGDVAHLMLACAKGDKWIHCTPIPFYGPAS